MQRAYARVEREAIDGSREQAEPKAILVGGQPGAGKTAIPFIRHPPVHGDIARRSPRR
ncbi:zeta toxin family protein [Burkholderia sp. BCC1047]|uniref:zeta toxin family protein n=1 Tax=Burkholderia sp. BCC1047 TaxID=2676299 RepID=UPI001FC89FCD|nr:zeta toxin family protein [Burkholderia sp. BCC1047]